MLNPIADLPSGVIGFEASGKIEAEDYRDVLLPAIQKAAADGEVRIVMVLPEFEGLSGGALPHPDGILIVLSRLNRILEIDIPNLRVTVEPGVTNLNPVPTLLVRGRLVGRGVRLLGLLPSI